MKYLGAFLFGIFAAGFVFLCSSSSGAAANNVWLSSNTVTADTAQALCTQPNMTRRGIFHGACVNRGAVNSTVAIYNSSATAVVPIATIQTSTAMPCSIYDVLASSGITYTTSSTADVTILYTCY